MQLPNGLSPLTDQDEAAQPDSTVASASAAQPSPVAEAALASSVPAEADVDFGPGAPSLRAEPVKHAKPAQPARGPSRQRMQQVKPHRQAGQPLTTASVARAWDEAAVPHSRSTADAVQNPIGPSRRPAELALQHAKSGDMTGHQHHPQLRVPSPEGAAQPSSPQDSAMPAAHSPQPAATRREQGRQQHVYPRHAVPVAHLPADAAAQASGSGPAADIAGQYETGAAVDTARNQDFNPELAALMRQLLPGAMPIAGPQAPQPRPQQPRPSPSAASLLRHQPNRVPSYRPVQSWNPPGMQAPLPSAPTASAARPQPSQPAGTLPSARLPVPELVAGAAAPSLVQSQQAIRTGGTHGQRAPVEAQAPMQATVLHMAEMECPITQVLATTCVHVHVTIMPVTPQTACACSYTWHWGLRVSGSGGVSDPQDVMHDPVIAADGHTYERSAIEQWFNNHDTSPMTNERLPDKHLISNVLVRRLIQSYRDSNPSMEQG